MNKTFKETGNKKGSASDRESFSPQNKKKWLLSGA